MEIKFTIYGNQDNSKGNPIPYLRSTKRQQWKPQVKRYYAWHDYIRSAFFNGKKRPDDFSFNIVNFGKPINLKKNKAQMNIRIYWADEKHGDPDNVWKGIADALFVDDKYLDGAFQSRRCTNNIGRVVVEIYSNF